MRKRALLLSAVLALFWTPGLAQDIEASPPEAEVTDLYPAFDDGLPPNTLDVMELVSLAATGNPELEALHDNWRIAQAVKASTSSEFRKCSSTCCRFVLFLV